VPASKTTALSNKIADTEIASRNATNRAFEYLWANNSLTIVQLKESKTAPYGAV